MSYTTPFTLKKIKKILEQKEFTEKKPLCYVRGQDKITILQTSKNHYSVTVEPVDIMQELESALKMEKLKPLFG